MLLMLPLLSRLNQYGLQAYIKAAGASAETQTGDAFGKAVATDGDTLAVGAPSQASSTGAVYLYTRAGEGGQWAPAVVLKAPNARSTDYFGQALAVHDDLVAVGAHGEDSCATGVAFNASSDDGCRSAGAVYLFQRHGTSWDFHSYIKAPNAGSTDYFGWSVALSADTLVVGAYNENAGATDHFGWSVALQGDTLAVGAYGEDGCATGVSKSAAADNACQSAGAVYLYHRGHGDWQFYRYVKAPNAGNNDNFGYSLALTDRTLAVGARNEDSCATGVSVTAAADNSCSSSGAVYLHQLPFVHFGSAGGVVGPRGSGRGGTVGVGSGGGIAIAGLVLILIISAYCARIALKRAQLCKNVGGGVSERCAIHTRDVILGTHLQQISPSAEDRDDIATLPPASSSFERVVSRTHREPSSSEML